MTNGVTITGFKRKRLDAILNDKNDGVRTILGENLNLSPESPDGQINGLYAASDAELWELAEACYNAFAPSKATGASLSDLVEINGINRFPATSTKVVCTIYGVNGTTVPAGSLVSTSDGSAIFATLFPVIIPLSGEITVEVEATAVGPITVPINTITNIDTPIVGWNAVDNLVEGVEGNFEESDAALRIRREKSVARAAKNTSDTILAEVLAQTGVIEGFLYENNTSLTDPVTGTPAGHFQVVVLGGSVSDIANAIGSEKPTSVPTFGTTTGQFIDSQGTSHDINFTIPSEIPIYIIVELTKFANYPSDGDARIKQNIVDYAAGLLIAGRGYGVGDDVIESELYSPVNFVPGHSIVSIKLGTTPAPINSNDIAIAFNQISTFNIANIEVI